MAPGWLCLSIELSFYENDRRRHHKESLSVRFLNKSIQGPASHHSGQQSNASLNHAKSIIIVAD